MIKFHFLLPFTLKQRRRLQQFIKQLIGDESGKKASVNYIFCQDDYLLEINKEFLAHDELTDIITFDLSPGNLTVEGEIYISIDRVRENAGLFHISVSSELYRVMFHGALHLCGYQDKSTTEKAQMSKKENYYLNLYLEGSAKEF